ncbi:MAG: (Fe-S)-binding protein [Ignavibacteria bacterium]|nr:(Fe-S)-binding protein [Ignavibacteria bacterium]
MNNFYSHLDLPSEEIISSCIHCGMCLQSCPTYNLTFDELSSPRGRIRLIKYVAEGKLQLTEKFAYEMNFCLDCQACETACPAGVKYGSLVEAARVQVEHSEYTSSLSRLIKKVAFRKILPNFKYLKLFAKLLRFYQNSLIGKFAAKILRVISKKLYEVNRLAPRVSSFFTDEIFPEKIQPLNEKKFTVLFPVGCLMNVMFAEENKDTIELLTKLGCEVIIPKKQTCCGSLPAHNGDLEQARKLAKATLESFKEYDFDFVISNSAGCGAFMKEYKHILKDDKEYSSLAKKFSDKVKDITEFLYQNYDFTQFKSEEPLDITYHEPCHLVHTQKVSNEPKLILLQIQNLNLIPLNEATWCCGSAGIYNVVNYEPALKILERKMNNIKNTNAKIVLTGNPGCLGQIRYGKEIFNMNVEVLHPVTLLNRIIKSGDLK